MKSQIFRIDHYLTKELVGNIALVRFTNLSLNRSGIIAILINVQIILMKIIGMDGRGSFYDKYGALADVMQNHMMQLWPLLAWNRQKN